MNIQVRKSLLVNNEKTDEEVIKSQQLETIILFQAVFLLNHAVLSDFMHFQP